MRLLELTVLYLLVGAGAAVAFLVMRRPLTAGSFVDAALLGAFWPLYGPFLLLHGPQSAEAADAMPLAVSAPADPPPLASLLPDLETARALERGLALARSRVADIARLLAQPELSEGAALARQAELEARGDDRAAATARQRVLAIRRLRQLRGRFATELDEISELLAQARIQAEVVRLAGEDDGHATRELIGELQIRMEALDEMLGEGNGDPLPPPLEAPLEAPVPSR
jgi:hypothetical protein